MTLFRRSEIYLTTRSSIYPTRYLTAWRIWSICELYIFCYCYTIIFIWCLHYMRMTRFAIICIFLLWCSTFWRDEKRDEPSVIFGFIPWSFLLTRRIFSFFFFLFDIIITNTRTQRGRKIHKNKLKVLDEKIFIANINLETLQVISLFFIFIKSFSIFLIFCDY